MTRNQRIALVVAALAVAVVAFLVASPGGDDDESDRAATTTPAQPDGQNGSPDTDTDTGTETEPPPPPKSQVTRIRIVGGEVVGGPKTIEVTRGDVVRIVVTADAPDELHLHGYDITRNAGPGQPARFRIDAMLEGAFEMESHVAEDAGKDPLVARLVVEPT
jgi:FtsP/CotA-like multicopper oxidase with cupredoxin domain